MFNSGCHTYHTSLFPYPLINPCVSYIIEKKIVIRLKHQCTHRYSFYPGYLESVEGKTRLKDAQNVLSVRKFKHHNFKLKVFGREDLFVNLIFPFSRRVYLALQGCLSAGKTSIRHRGREVREE